MLVVFSIFLVLAVGVTKKLDPDLAPLLWQRRALTDEEVAAHQAVWIYLWIMFSSFAITMIWGFIAWGSYRHLTGLSKLRSFFAFWITAVTAVPGTLLAYYLVVGLLY
jgi:hypothetical protein